MNASENFMFEEDILIIGAGLAGLYLALKLAPRPCTILTPYPIGNASSSAWAQGGIAAALAPQDNADTHAEDTIKAGAGLVDPTIARLVAHDGPERILDLIELGVPFDKSEKGDLLLSLEAAHSYPRVARVAGDLAGKAIMQALSDAVEASDHITMRIGLEAVNLLKSDNGQIAGVIAEDLKGRRHDIQARETVLCVGGSGGLFEVTTNPKSALGHGFAMAHKAGALLSDLEFVQFHPTAIDVGRDPAPLATEALRGEGATLINQDGNAFMQHYHEKAELAPRDEVARAIHLEKLEGRGAYLDARKAVGAAFPEHFPTVYGACVEAGIDPIKEAIPVAPGAHYHMGGIVSDIWGRSSLEGLSACGECSSTGLHGANRLASNSLLEAVVFAERIARRLRQSELPQTAIPANKAGHEDLPLEVLASLRRYMSLHCGVVREKSGLGQFANWIDTQKEIYPEALSLLAAELIVMAALQREESRGGHFRKDHPDKAQPKRSFQRKRTE